MIAPSPLRVLLKCQCRERECEYRRRVTAASLERGPWPEHCGRSMIFATTFDEEQFHQPKASATLS